MAYYGNHKKHLSGKSILAIVIAVLIVAAAFVTAWGIGSEGFTQNNPLHFFNDWGTATVQPDNKGDEPTDEDYSELVVTVNPDSGIMTLAVDDNGATAESVTVKASVDPPTAKDRKINFTLAFTREGYGNVSDYVALTVNGYNATVECLQAFSCPIILTASIENTDLSATCTFNYIMPLNKTTGVFSTNSEVTSTQPASSKLIVGDTNYVFFSDSAPGLYGAGSQKGSIYINYVEFWLHLAEGKISETESFANLCDYMTANDLGSVAVRTESAKHPKFDIYAYYETGYINFSFDYLDFFEFTGWTHQTDDETSNAIKNYCKAALLEACPNGGNTMKIPVKINYSYVLGNKSFTYTDTPYVTFDFENLTNPTTDVTLNENEYVFGG